MDCKYATRQNSEAQQQQQGMKWQLQNEIESVHLSLEKQQRFVHSQSLLQPTNTNLLPKPLIPIDDFYLLDNPNKYGDEERQLRIKLTAVYRLIEINGWSMGIYNHVTVSSSRVNFQC